MEVKIKQKRIIFDPNYRSDFYKVLISRVDEYFRLSGKSKKANALLIIKSAIYLAWMIVGYAILYFTDLSVGWTFFVFITTGLGSTLFVINIAHDASHHALSSKKWVNRLFSYGWNLVGISSYMWDLIHNQSHHVFTNMPERDPDISQISQRSLIRLNPSAKWSPHQRYQHYYTPVLYMFYSFFFIFFKDVPLYKEHQFGNRYIIQHPSKEWYILFATKIFYLVYSLILPLIFINHPWWLILLMYLSMHAISGLIVAILLITPHVNSDTDFIYSDEQGKVAKCWGLHQMESTIDFAGQSLLVSLFSGGLNTHVAHHLFPAICHVHYRDISKIIEETANEFHIPYRNKGFVAAIDGHFQYLKMLGQSPSWSGQSSVQSG